jgi:hypothetical protein
MTVEKRGGIEALKACLKLESLLPAPPADLPRHKKRISRLNLILLHEMIESFSYSEHGSHVSTMRGGRCAPKTN